MLCNAAQLCLSEGSRTVFACVIMASGIKGQIRCFVCQGHHGVNLQFVGYPTINLEKVLHTANLYNVSIQAHASYDWHNLAVGDEHHLVSDRHQHLFSGPAQTMQEFIWQVDVRSVVLCVRLCCWMLRLLLLLTLTVILHQISLDVAEMMQAFDHSF